MLDDLNVPTLEELGLKEEDVKTIAELAMGNACLPDNPCDVAEKDFQAMLMRGLEAS
jgi:alcohol dehydrogenase class IV